MTQEIGRSGVMESGNYQTMGRAPNDDEHKDQFLKTIQTTVEQYLHTK